MENKISLTELEKQVLINIAESEYIDVTTIEQLLNYPTWSFVATDQKKELTGALSSCVKKGLVGCDNTVKGDETVWLTQLGVDMLQTFYCYR